MIRPARTPLKSHQARQARARGLPGVPYARLQGLLFELTPGKAKKDITAMQAKGNSRNGAPEGPGRQDPAAG